jgi:hypothetical protein
MAAITIEVTFDRDNPKEGEQPTYTRRLPVDPVKIPLSLIEGVSSQDFGMARRALARFLKLTKDESEQLTIEHMNLIAKAAGDAAAIPNG